MSHLTVVREVLVFAGIFAIPWAVGTFVLWRKIGRDIAAGIDWLRRSRS